MNRITLIIERMKTQGKEEIEKTALWGIKEAQPTN
jgi:hypothetical protein